MVGGDFTVQQQEKPVSVDDIEGDDNAMFTLVEEELEERTSEDDEYDEMIPSARWEWLGLCCRADWGKSTTAKIAEALEMDEEQLKKLKKFSGSALKMGAKVALPGVLADLASAGIDLVLG